MCASASSDAGRQLLREDAPRPRAALAALLRGRDDYAARDATVGSFRMGRVFIPDAVFDAPLLSGIADPVLRECLEDLPGQVLRPPEDASRLLEDSGLNVHSDPALRDRRKLRQLLVELDRRRLIV